MPNEVGIKTSCSFYDESSLRDISEGREQLKTLGVRIEGAEVSTDVTLLSRVTVRLENFTIISAESSQLEAILTAVTETPDLALKVITNWPEFLPTSREGQQSSFALLFQTA